MSDFEDSFSASKKTDFQVTGATLLLPGNHNLKCLMLQAARTHLIIPEPSEDLITNEPWSVEFYADGLMDEIFADIDEILHGNGNSLNQDSRTPRSIEFDNDSESTTPVASKYDHLHTINMPQIVSPNGFTTAEQTVPPVQNDQVGTVVVRQPGAIIQRRNNRLNLTKLLITGTSIGVAIAGTLYILQSGLGSLLTSRLTEPDIYIAQNQTQSPQATTQSELVNYMLGALTILEQEGKTNNPTSANSSIANRSISPSSSVVAANNQPPGDLPPPLAANNTQPIAKSSTNVVERIYIPVYQAPSPMRYAPPPQIATNPQTSPPNAVPPANQSANTNQVAAAVRPEVKPVPSAPMTVNQPPVPSLPVAPTRPATPSTNSQQQASLPNPVASPSHTLAGLLELGDKSAALFEFEGVTRRIHIGESIGATGWTLVDIANGEAIVRRNGEVRSIFAGQKL
ncbi:hypothetical protein VB620_12575 [Nodularia harveyana UHCC-0300]|uniref:Type II secretion system protein GspC N-terminal domain-containing protein n=1 Tax=Nodularia harveyana UHCC-0300 TaxID=2974287 RepID=A0ABU5UF30_9CYAN|nr:hypothetical protein [Nodularia harveyana]MEA5582173.1 hypothetical protein [Nodularia harveyana UHCC-0300]